MSRPESAPDRSAAVPVQWSGLGKWNFYFLAKFALAWMGHLNLQVLPNLVFAAALLLPLQRRGLRKLRTLIALPVAAALLYHDTWLPPFSRLLEQPGVWDFSPAYLLELLGRFIDWNVLGWLFIGWVAYLFLSQWLRLTTFSLIGLLWLSISASSIGVPQLATATTTHPDSAASFLTTSLPPADDDTLNAYLEDFYRQEATRQTRFQTPVAEPFDLLLLNICSLSWDDLDAIGMSDNALFRQMDIIFDNFNSATAYSGPAAIRLLRASCGQPSHTQLYEQSPAQCLLFDNLRQLGFSNELMLNHNGEFDDFLGELRAHTGLPGPALPDELFRRRLISFDGSPIWSDQDVLSQWWEHRQRQDTDRMALFYNSITLHDGNRIVQPGGSTRSADFRTRTQMLLDDLSAFIKQLEQSGRRVVLLLVPEHGAALRGDRMQIPGMREIPSPAITHVPVGVKLIGMGTPELAQPLRVSQPSSYFALSEIIARLLATPSFAQEDGFDWQTLLSDLPATAAVAENRGTVVLQYDGTPYVRIKERGAWLPYPQRQ